MVIRVARLGIDIGGSTIRAILLKGDGETEVSSVPTPKQNSEKVIECTVELVGRLGSQVDFSTVGVGAAGRFANGKVYFSTDSMPEDWQGTELKKKLEGELETPVKVLNDGSAATYGELVRGRGKSLTDFVLFTVGTGIGGGVVVNNQLVTGGYGSPGELGHISHADGVSCSCGRQGCLELFASGRGLYRKYSELHQGQPDEGTFWQLAPDKNREIRQLFHRASRKFSLVMLDLQEVLAPQAFVFGGGVIEKQPSYLELIRGSYKSLVNGLDSVLEASVLESELGPDLVALGAALYAAEVEVDERV